MGDILAELVQYSVVYFEEIIVVIVFLGDRMGKTFLRTADPLLIKIESTPSTHVPLILLLHQHLINV